MTLDRYYYVTSLPNLGELGSAAPIGLADLRVCLADNPTCRQIVDLLLVHDDLLLREACLVGEPPEAHPAVLSDGQLRDETPLPSWLATQEVQPEVPEGNAAEPDFDTIWEAYFRHLDGVATQFRCRLLADWARHEVTLRNALASARARRLGLDESECQVALDLAENADSADPAVGDWEAASTPLGGLQSLLRSRWAWLAEHDQYYTFRNDELAAYALRLMLLHQWQRIANETPSFTERHLV